MDVDVLIRAGLIALAAALVLLTTARVRARRRGRGVPGSPARTVPLAELPAQTRASIDRLLSSGRKIEAIKELRSATGLSLGEAKNAVDAWEAGAPAVAEASRPPVAGASLDPAIVADVDGLLARGSTIAAIKVLRERTGWGLKEAKERVDRWVPGRG